MQNVGENTMSTQKSVEVSQPVPQGIVI